MRLLLLAFLLMPSVSSAEGLTLFSVTDGQETQDYTVKLQILLILTAIGFLPTMLLMMTSFTRIVVVLGILRQALGLQQSPPNKVLIGIALCLTMLIMRPVWTEIYTEALVPWDNSEITMKQAVSRAEIPVREFMLRQTDEASIEQMLTIANEPLTIAKEEVPFSVLMPAFVLSELKTAFQIGFMLFIPFLIIDLIVASVLMSMGMMMLSPLIISLPFKLMVFVMADGWTHIVGSLTASFG